MNFGLTSSTAPASSADAKLDFKFSCLPPAGNQSIKATLSPTTGDFSFSSPVNVADESFKLFPKTPKILQTLAATDTWSSTLCHVKKSSADKKEKATLPSTAGWGSSVINAAAGKWSCAVCLIKNADAKEKCAACNASKPASRESAGSTAEKNTVPAVADSWGDLFKKADGR